MKNKNKKMNKMMNKVRVWVIFSQEEVAIIDDLAYKEKRSRSNLICKITTDHINSLTATV